MRLKATGREVALIVKLSSVSDPFVNKNEAWSVLVEQFAQHIARTRRLFVISLHPCEGLLAAKLPSEFAPQRPDDGAVRLRARISRGDLVAHQDDALHRGQLLYASVRQDCVDAQQLARGGAAKQV